MEKVSIVFNSVLCVLAWLLLGYGGTDAVVVLMPFLFVIKITFDTFILVLKEWRRNKIVMQ